MFSIREAIKATLLGFIIFGNNSGLESLCKDLILVL